MVVRFCSCHYCRCRIFTRKLGADYCRQEDARVLHGPCHKPPPLLLASFPRSGSSMLRHYLESVTGNSTGSDFWILCYGSLASRRGLRCGIVALKTHRPLMVAMPSNGLLTEKPFGLNDGASFDKAVVLLRNPLHAIYSYFHFTMASRVQHIDRRRALHNYSLTDEELARFAGAAPGAAWWTGPG